MPTLLFNFANSETQSLNTLRTEDDGLQAAMQERMARKDFTVLRDQYATREKMVAALRQFQPDLTLFWYSGHAGRDRLELEDGTAQAGGIAAMLGRCPNLKLVGLNGCSTAGQAKMLLEQGIPMVIATSAPVDDETAAQFAIAFFDELARKHSSIRKAFETGIDVARVYGTISATAVRSYRSVGFANEEAPGEWTLYHQEKDADLLDNWRLPEAAQTDNIPVNDRLLDALKIIALEQLPGCDKEEILKRLPFTLSEPIRKLLAPRDNSGQLFYDRPAPERYRMLLYAYQNLVNFLCHVLLSQFWRDKQALNDTIDLESGFRDWLLGDFRNDQGRSLFPLFERLAALLQTRKQPFFLGELPEALKKLDNPDYREAFDFLELQLQEAAGLSPEEATYRCPDCEMNLALALCCFGFLVHYTLTSVKDISVLWYMHDMEPKFDHKVVRLQQQMTALEDRSEIASTYLKTASVLLRRADNPQQALYLSPFLIDENAYTRTPKANLRAAVAYDRANRYFYFRQVSKPEDLLRIERKQVNPLAKLLGEGDENDYFPLIHGQFSAFCKDLFGKTLDDL